MGNDLKWTDEFIIETLRGAYIRSGFDGKQPLSSVDFSEVVGSASVYAAIYNRKRMPWAQLCAMAGLPDPGRDLIVRKQRVKPLGPPTNEQKERVIKQLRRHLISIGHAPTLKEYTGPPSLKRILAHGFSFSEAIAASGFGGEKEQ